MPDPDYAALALFRHLVRRFLAFSEAAARKAGLPPDHHQVLLAVKGLPPDSLPTVGALAWQLQFPPARVARRVRRLVASRYLRLLPHRLDPRDDLIEVAPRGEAVLRKLSIAHRDELRRMAPQILPALADLYHPHQKELSTCPTPSPWSPPRKEILRGPRPVSPTSPPRRGLSLSASLRLRSARSAPMSPSPSSS